MQTLQKKTPFHAQARPSYTSDARVVELTKMAEKAFNEKQWERAGPLFEELVSLRPTFYTHAVRAGISYLCMASPATTSLAVKYLKQSCSLMPLLCAPRCLLARALQLQGKKEEAMVTVRDALMGANVSTALKDENDSLLEGIK